MSVQRRSTLTPLVNTVPDENLTVLGSMAKE